MKISKKVWTSYEDVPSLLGVDLCALQLGGELEVLAVELQDVVDPLAVAPRHHLHRVLEPLAHVDVHHLADRHTCTHTAVKNGF